MATGGLYGSTSTGTVAPQSGSESVGLYGNNTVFGGSYFEWFIFQEAATQPATPTGGSWSFSTNSGTAPTGWTSVPPAAPTTKVWVSIALVNSKTTAILTWSTPGLFSGTNGTVSNVSALTLGTAGTDVSSTVANPTTTPVITLNLPTASATNRGALSAADWTTFNSKGTGSVISVAATVPSFLSVAGSPITTSGTLAISYSGTALPVVNGGTGVTTSTGTGSNVLSTSPSLTTPIQVTYEDWTAIAAPTYAEGRLWYDSTAHALAYFNDAASAVVHVGHDLQVKVINNTGSTIPNGSPVYITGTTSGQTYPNIALAKADVAATASVIGLTNGAIANGAFGYVTSTGTIDNVNTGTFTVGQVLYLSPYSAGQLMNTLPPTGITVQVGVVSYINSSTGKIYVKQTTPLAVPASIITGAVAIANGGTGQTTQAAAITALAGTQASGQYLRSNGTNTLLSAIQAADVPTLNQNTTGTAANITATSNSTLTTLSALILPYSQLSGTVPTWNQNTTGTASNVTGVVAIANGGTGQTTAAAAITALAGTQASGQYLRSNGTNTLLSSIQAADVPTLNQNTTGTASNVTGTVAIANGGTGATTAAAALTNLGAYPASNPSGYTNNTGTVTSVAATVPAFLSVTGSPITTSGTLAISYSGTALPIANGGTGLTTTPANGALDIGNGTGFTRTTLTAGTGISVTNASGSITIAASGGTGTVTSVAATVPSFLSIAGSPITTSGTLAISYSGTALPVANGGTGVTTSTGTGNVVLSTSPTLVTPALGTPSSGVMTNVTGINYDGFKNRIINGALQFWYRGTSFTGSGQYTADRWATDQPSNIISQSSDVPNTSYNYSIDINANGAGNTPALYQRIESYNIQDVASGTVTISFWGKLISGTATTTVNLRYPATRDVYSGTVTSFSSTNVTLTTSWAQYSVTVSSLPAGVANGLMMYFIGTNGADFRVTGVQLEKGSTATSFDYRSYSTELALCQRYYYSSDKEQLYSALGTGWEQSTTAGTIYCPLPVPMRVTPTSVSYSTLQLNDSGGANLSVSSLTLDLSECSRIMAKISTTIALGVIGRVASLRSANSTSGFIAFSAEL